MSKIFKWNVKDIITRATWDPTKGVETYNTEGTSLKSRLRNPNGKRMEDHVADIGLGLAQIMDEIEFDQMSTEERFRHQVMGEWPEKPQEKQWVALHRKCPECGDEMIENKKYVECSGPHCRYIEEIKK